MTVTKVSLHNGSPTIFINEIPVSPFYLWGSKEVVANFARKDSGIHMYSVVTDLGWEGPHKYNYAKIDETIKTILESDPLGYLIPHVNCNSPYWWNEAHKEELTIYDDGKYDDQALASYASLIWIEEVKEALSRYVRHTLDSDYGEHMIGYHPGAGFTGEWNKHRGQDGFYWDFSKPMINSFTQWLRKKYKDSEANLRSAWGNEHIDFSKIRIPTREEQRKTDLFSFRDPAKSQAVIDYYLFRSQLVANLIIDLGRTIKLASNNGVIVGVSYGYIVELWPGAFFSEEGFTSYEDDAIYNWGHHGLEQVLNSPHIDFVTTFVGNLYRCIGGDASYFSATESIMAHKKLFIAHDDTRTFLAKDRLGRSKNLKDSISVLRRNFTNALTRGNGSYWANLASPDTTWWWPNLSETDWYDHPQLVNEIKNVKEIADKALNLDRCYRGEVAIIVDESSFAYIGPSANLTYPLMTKWKSYELCRMGTPYSIYLKDDLVSSYLNNDTYNYKFYIFLNVFYLSENERNILKKMVQRNNNVVLWVYASGLIDEHGISLENMEDLTGFQLAMDHDKWGLNISISNFNHPITSDLPEHTDFGTDYVIGPIIYCEDTEATVLGNLIYNNGRYSSGFCVKEFDNWTSIFVGAPMIPASVLRNIAKYAGAHIYNEKNDVFYANKNFIAIHTISSGKRLIKLPHRTNVYDVFEKREIGRNVTAFVDDIPEFSTKLYFIGKEKLFY